MFETIVLKGHYRWIVPIAIVLITVYLISFYNNLENFNIEENLSVFMDKVKNKEVLKDVEKKIKKDKKEIKEIKKDKKEIKKDKKDKKEIKKDKKDVNKVLDLVKTLKSKIDDLKLELKDTSDKKKANNDIKLLNKLEEEIKNILSSKENYVNFSNKKDITGYNYGEYSSNFESIFPNRKINKSNIVKFKTKPDIIGYETDINKKILEYESTNGLVLSTYNPTKLNDRPKYMYNRHDGKITPHITDENRFDVSQFNVFRH